MSDPLISAKVNVQPVVDALRQLEKRAIDPSPALREIGEAVLLSTDTRWDKEIDPFGNRWKPNSPYTIAKKRAEGRIQKILQSRGILRSSIRYRVDSGRLIVGTNISYAEENQNERQFLGFSKEDVAESIKIMDQYLTDGK